MNRAAKGKRNLRAYLDFVRFEHTLFALPFAYVGMLLAAQGRPTWWHFLWITVAMVGARTAAMALNRVIDARIDAANPRTADREIPRGVLRHRDGLILAALGLILLAAAGWALNPLTRNLLPVAALALALYPYTKRFTWLCHGWLGLTVGAAAAGGWIAVTGTFAAATLVLWLGVAAWIAGFDIVYALQDAEFDRGHGLHSIPARFGEPAALRVAAALHLLAWLALASLLALPGLGWPYGLALAAVAAILLVAQLWVRRRGAAAALRSFDANLYVSATILLGVAADLLLFA